MRGFIEPAFFTGSMPSTLYGLGCYAPGGCADVVAAMATRIDARAYNPSYPPYFPRFIQFGIFAFASAGGYDICNGNRIDDGERCAQRFCPAYVRLRPHTSSSVGGIPRALVLKR